MRKKILPKLLIAVVVILLAADLFISNYLVNYAIGRSGDGGDREVSLDVETPGEGVEKTIADNRALQQIKNEEFLAEHPGETVGITSDDGLALNGVYYENTDSHLWVITLHGYRSDHRAGVAAAQHFYDAGYQVLSPDLRACGDSEGDYVGMGWLDRKDVLDWVDWVTGQDTSAKIVLYGVSMGAATTMMTSGEDTPDQVCAFVEDCGYTSVWDIFSNELKLRFGLPEFPVLYSASALSSVKARYSFKEASALKQVASCEKPMMFIHGTADDFIPYEMMDTLYQAKPGDNKTSLTAEGAGHGEAMYVLGDAYWESVFSFLGQYM